MSAEEKNTEILPEPSAPIQSPRTQLEEGLQTLNLQDDPIENSAVILQLPSNVETEEAVNQDAQQKRNALMNLAFELYRVVMGSCLTIFVPQECTNDLPCSFSENIGRSDVLSKLALAMNFITFCSFIMMYGVEAKRENKMITYLEVNPMRPTDTASVEDALCFLDDTRKERLWALDRYYGKTGYVAMVFFIFNAILSGYSISGRYLNQTTLTVLGTNILFMGLKIYDVFGIVYTDKNVFYSSYLKKRIQYNDVDPDKYKEGSDVLP
jgi:hypothetical protein